MPAKVKVVPALIEDKAGYDLLITDPSATVQDYLSALDQAIEELPLSRGRGTGMVCQGCDRCCAERIPLTSIDMHNLHSLMPRQSRWHSAVARYGFVTVDGPEVDIVMRRREDGRCVFLDPATRLCGIYKHRPFVCRTYICSPLMPRAERLRDLILNAGEDELVRQWLADADERGADPVIHEGEPVLVELSHWNANSFTGCRGFEEIPVRSLAPKLLWWELYGQGTD